MIKIILMILFGIFGVYLLVKMVMWFIPYALVGGGLYLGYRWVDNKLRLGENKEATKAEEVKEIEVKVVEEEPEPEQKPIEEPKSLEERIEKLKEGGA
ncbi:MAG: hypothetical protein COA79_18685 [Planctomycetota bacterium]|nr:MAG: hypothetical protein COA79_18685 [Planctomycetota bacterium]